METFFPTVLKATLIAQEAEGITLLLSFMASYHKMLCTKSLCTTIIKSKATKNNYVYILFMVEHASNKLYFHNS